MLSVDAFHQETIPIDPVKRFAELAVASGVPVRLSPAWLVSREDDNPYNLKTRELLKQFEYLGIPEGDGNVIFASGNALKYLGEYFTDDTVSDDPYEDDPRDVRAISFEPNGDVLGGNIYHKDILGIIDDYRP